MVGALPEHLAVGDTDCPIRSDYRNVLQVFEAFSAPELSQQEKMIVSTYLFYEDFSCADDVFEAVKNGFDLEEAQKQMQWFISAGMPDGVKLEKPVYSWTQDEQMIFSAVNKVAGKETRELGYLHWWTFLGYFREVGEGTFSFVSGIRHKLNHGKKLEKHEKEFLKNNKEIVLLKFERPMTEEERKEDERIKALADEVLG